MLKIRWSLPLTDNNDLTFLYKILLEYNESKSFQLDDIIDKLTDVRSSKKEQAMATIRFFTIIDIIQINKNSGTIMSELPVLLSNEDILKYISNQSYKELLPFKFFIDIIQQKNIINKDYLRQRLSEEILSQAKEKHSEEYINKINKISFDEKLWRFPKPSYSRLIRIATGAKIINVDKNVITFIGFNDKNKNEINRLSKEDFEKHFISIYKELTSATNDIIQSIDEIRNILIKRYSIDVSTFNLFFEYLLSRKRNIQEFRGRLGNEEGFEKKSGEIIYRIAIRGIS